MSEDQQLTIKVSLSALKIMHDSAEPYYYRVDSLIEDHYQGIQTFKEDSLIAMMELRISLQVLLTYLKELIEQAEEEEVESLHVPPAELKTIAGLAKGLSSATLIQLDNTNLRDQ